MTVRIHHPCPGLASRANDVKRLRVDPRRLIECTPPPCEWQFEAERPAEPSDASAAANA